MGRAPSNQRAWALLGRACAEAALTGSGPKTVIPMLRRALEALGAERAFVVSWSASRPSSPPRVRAALARPSSLEKTPPSRSVVRRALEHPGPFLCPDVRGDGALSAEASVRALSLRAVYAARLADEGWERRALVLDSRDGRDSLAGCEPDLLRGFAFLLDGPRNGAVPPRGPTPPPPAPDAPALVGGSPAFRTLLDSLPRVAASRLPVLVRGESGTGKEGIAREIHRLSPRGRGPFLAVNCAAFPETLLEAELFGAVRGSYTGADRDRPGLFVQAHGGTLLLDEIGDMPLPMQAKILRALQEGRIRPVGGAAEVLVDVRIVAATHRDLRELSAARSFRPDLLYRLAILELRVPPLRERLEDVPALATHLLDRLHRASGLPAARLSSRAEQLLGARSWPGNVRQLESVLARAVVEAGGGEIRPEHMPRERDDREPAPGRALEREMIDAALAAEGGVLARAATRIGWTRQKLYRRMRALGMGPGGASAGTTSSDSSTFQ